MSSRAKTTRTPGTGGVPTSTVIRGARMHNLRRINCEIPLRKITVITGVSGSGKSTLAFDVLYAEGQRRFVECLSAYARQFLERLERPKVDRIGYIQPAIALKQHLSIRNARSTVGSITELTDHLRLLYVHAGQVHCRVCGAPVVRNELSDALKVIQALPEDTRIAIVAPLQRPLSSETACRLLDDGYTRLFLSGQVIQIEDLLAEGVLLADALSKATSRPGRRSAPPGRPGRRSAAPGRQERRSAAPGRQERRSVAPGRQERRSAAGDEKGSVPAGSSRSGDASQIGVVIDRIVVGKARRSRLAESIQAAWKMGNGTCWLHRLDASSQSQGRRRKSTKRASTIPLIVRQGMTCSACATPSITPSVGLFSWNSPIGACPECQGFGRIITIDRNKVIPDRRRNLRNHAVVPFSVPSTRQWYRRLLRAARSREIPTDEPYEDLSQAQQDWIFQGDEDFPGVKGFFEKLANKRYKMHVRIFISRFRGYVPCPRCQGSRLKPDALSVTVGGKNIHELHETPIDELVGFFNAFSPEETEGTGIQSLLDGIRARLHYLDDVGIGYLTPGRAGRTLSGGETQRIRLAAALGSALTDTLYILDEPTVGLHATDTDRMMRALKQLTAMGNTVVVVEHDPGMIAGADHLIVLGPGGGVRGGRLIYEGPVAQFLKKHPGFFRAQPPSSGAGAGALGRSARRRSLRGLPKDATRRRGLSNPWNAEAVHRWVEGHTAGEKVAHGTAAHDAAASGAAAHLATAHDAAAHPAAASGATASAVTGSRFPMGPRLRLREAREHNLQIARLDLPLSRLIVITGVSGSGKSTLLDEIIHRNWLRFTGQPVEDVGRVGSIEGFDSLDDVHLVGQTLPGRSSRSNPISFVKAYGEIRKLLASTIRARQRQFQAGAFSFNTAGGRCEACKGMGTQLLEMYFLPDVEVPCEACGGKRFKPEVLEITWHDRNIDEILGMTVDEASVFFRSEPAIVERLAPLREVGLGYLALGQSTSTLSGGEAQRLRLASFLVRGSDNERHLFLFDEPTTGLHAQDIERLLYALHALMGRGHAVIAVEHQLDFIRAAHWVIDMGPGPGPAGGQIVYAGPVPGLLQHETSRTAQALREWA